VLLINGTADPLILYNGGAGKYQRNNQDEEQYDMLPTQELVEKIAKLNAAAATPVTEAIPDGDTHDNCTATRYTYQSNVAPTVFIKIQGGGHTWPGGKQYLPKFLIGNVCRDFKAETTICEFFNSIKPL
jgi:polyhydroxybutyrate depolymerase